MHLAGQLRAGIEDGAYPEGTLLPTEQELAARFAVSRQTVRAALDQLRQRGLVESRRGSGTRVISRTRALAQTFSATSVDDLISLVRDTVLEIALRSRFALPPALAARYGTDSGKPWLYIGCLRRDARDGSVQAWTDTYIDQRYAALTEGQTRLDTPLFERIEQAEGRPAARIRQEIRAVQLNAVMAKRLGAPTGAAALEITRSYYFDDGRLFEVAINTLAANRFHYAIELRGTEGRDGSFSERLSR